MYPHGVGEQRGMQHLLRELLTQYGLGKFSAEREVLGRLQREKIEVATGRRSQQTRICDSKPYYLKTTL